MLTRTPLRATDLFVVLEKAFRQRAPACHGCTFSIPYHDHCGKSRRDDWAVVLTQACSSHCHMILEELIGHYRERYSLAD